MSSELIDRESPDRYAGTVKPNSNGSGNGSPRDQAFQHFMMNAMAEVSKTLRELTKATAKLTEATAKLTEFADRSDRRWEGQEKRWKEQEKRWEEQRLQWQRMRLEAAERSEHVALIFEKLEHRIDRGTDLTVAALKDVAGELRSLRRGRGNGRSNGR